MADFVVCNFQNNIEMEMRTLSYLFIILDQLYVNPEHFWILLFLDIAAITMHI